MADEKPAAAATALGHYARLQEIEKRVVNAIEAASYAMSELSKEHEHMDKDTLYSASAAFVIAIQEAQQFVLEAIKAAAPDRDFEANNYYLMLQSMAAAEKLDAVSVHISGISKVLRDAPLQDGQQHDSPLPAATADEMIMDDAAAAFVESQGG